MSVRGIIPWLCFLGACGSMLVATGTSAQQPAAPAAPAASAASRAMPAGSVEHGRYIVERVVMCYECHSARDPEGNILAGTRYKGGAMLMRPPWRSDWPLQIPRIAGLPGYTDAEAMRLLTQGAIKRDGTQLRYPMPRFRMSSQDAADVIAYLRML